MDFKQEHTFETRLEESQRILVKYPERIPVICEKLKSAKNVPLIDKKKYLVPCDLSVGQFMYVIRKRIHLLPEQGLYLFINGTIPPSSEILQNLYRDHKDADGFLYIAYNCENTFGI